MLTDKQKEEVKRIIQNDLSHVDNPENIESIDTLALVGYNFLTLENLKNNNINKHQTAAILYWLISNYGLAEIFKDIVEYGFQLSKESAINPDQ